MIKECPFCGSIRIVETLKGDTSICLACESLLTDKSKPTLFDRITQSPEVLAEKFVYCENEEYTFSCASWCSTLLGNTSYARKEEAIAATVAKLKEVKDE
jgi:hypothetical protein